MAKKVSRRGLLGAIKRVLAKEDVKGAKADRIAHGVVEDLARDSGKRTGGRKRRRGHGPANRPKIDIPEI